MKLSRFALFLFFALATTVSPAQLAIYGNFDATHLSNNNDNTKSWFFGPNFGAYYNFYHFGPVVTGIDLRGNFLFGNNDQRYRSGLIGLRVAANPRVLPFKPYAQFSIGGGGTKRTNSGAGYNTKFQYDIFGGADVTIFPRLDLRLVEIGYGRMSGIGGGPDTPASNLVTVGSGIVFRFP